MFTQSFIKFSYLFPRYLQGGQMPVGVMLTANHLGYFKFALCPVDVWGEESEECFAAYPLNLTTGEDRLPVPTSEVGWYNATLQLPEDVTCRHCVVQWTYITGKGTKNNNNLLIA